MQTTVLTSVKALASVAILPLLLLSACQYGQDDRIWAEGALTFPNGTPLPASLAGNRIEVRLNGEGLISYETVGQVPTDCVYPGSGLHRFSDYDGETRLEDDGRFEILTDSSWLVTAPGCSTGVPSRHVMFERIVNASVQVRIANFNCDDVCAAKATDACLSAPAAEEAACLDERRLECQTVCRVSGQDLVSARLPVEFNSEPIGGAEYDARSVFVADPVSIPVDFEISDVPLRPIRNSDRLRFEVSGSLPNGTALPASIPLSLTFEGEGRGTLYNEGGSCGHEGAYSLRAPVPIPADSSRSGWSALADPAETAFVASPWSVGCADEEEKRVGRFRFDDTPGVHVSASTRRLDAEVCSAMCEALVSDACSKQTDSTYCSESRIGACTAVCNGDGNDLRFAAGVRSLERTDTTWTVSTDLQYLGMEFDEMLQAGPALDGNGLQSALEPGSLSVYLRHAHSGKCPVFTRIDQEWSRLPTVESDLSGNCIAPVEMEPATAQRFRIELVDTLSAGHAWRVYLKTDTDPASCLPAAPCTNSGVNTWQATIEWLLTVDEEDPTSFELRSLDHEGQCLDANAEYEWIYTSECRSDARRYYQRWRVHPVESIRFPVE